MNALSANMRVSLRNINALERAYNNIIATPLFNIYLIVTPTYFCFILVIVCALSSLKLTF